MKQIKLSLFTEGMIIYMGNLKKKISGTDYSKVEDIRLMYKSYILSYTLAMNKWDFKLKT